MPLRKPSPTAKHRSRDGKASFTPPRINRREPGAGETASFDWSKDKNDIDRVTTTLKGVSDSLSP